MNDILAFEPFIANIEIGRKIDACQVTKMNRAIGIRKCGSDKGFCKLMHGVKEKYGYTDDNMMLCHNVVCKEAPEKSMATTFRLFKLSVT